MTTEQETHIVYDYAVDQVRIFTTRESVIRQLISRSTLKDTNIEIVNNGYGYSVVLPLASCRNPGALVKGLGRGNPTLGQFNKDKFAALANSTEPDDMLNSTDDDYVDMNIS
jgi:hypothetical protein